MIPPEEFAALMAHLGPWGRRVAVAVSGGADSLCLAWLAKRWGDPVGLIVDHGVRPESAAEAAVTVTRLASFGVPSHVLRLHLPLGPGLAARARAARYAALTQACAELGLTDLLLGHHAQDQAETVLMRQDAASGPGGLAGMAALAEHHAVRLVRPLLGKQPHRLRATLRTACLAWVEDPSNRNPAALRTRLRDRLADDAALAARLLATAAQAAAARCLAEVQVATTLAERASLFPEGYALLTPGPLAPDCLAALIRMLGGRPYKPHARALARLAAAPAPATLGGVRLMPAGRLGQGRGQAGGPGPGTLLLLREPVALASSVAAVDGAVWDGRFVLSAPGKLPPGTRMGALGQQAVGFGRASHLPYAVLRTLPALLAGPHILAVPHLGPAGDGGAFTGWTNPGVRMTLCPAYSAAGAGWMGDAQAAQTHHVPGQDVAEADAARPGARARLD